MAITRLGGATAITGTIPQGNIANASLGAVTALPAAISTGKVLQVVSASKTDTTSTTSSSYTDITGMSVSITPSSTSNKIFTLFDINLSTSSTGRNDFVRLMRDSTAIVDPINYWRLSDTTFIYNACGSFLDTPSSTSSLTFKLQWLSEGGSNTVYLNRRGDNSLRRATSTITVMEIAS